MSKVEAVLRIKLPWRKRRRKRGDVGDNGTDRRGHRKQHGVCSRGKMM